MRDTRDEHEINETESPETSGPDAGAETGEAERGAEANPDTEQPGGMTPEEAEDIVSLARSGDEVPVGAEDFAEALRIVAAQRDEHFDTLQRLGADYQNFQRRARQNERESRELASMGVVQSLLQVLDFFDMALKQDPEKEAGDVVPEGVPWARYPDGYDVWLGDGSTKQVGEDELFLGKTWKLNAERNNGRAAMMGITGMLIHEALTGNPVFPIGETL